MNWKKYENEIFENFKMAYPNLKISYDQTIVGKYSKTERQIDVLMEGKIAGKDLKIVIDGKYYSKKIDVKGVDSFISMVEDIGGSQGILVTPMGYSKAAINRAYYGPTEIELDILNFEELKNFQGFGGITHSGWHGALIPAPFGWVVDGTQREGSIANLYQRGKTYEEATKDGEFIYFNILSFDENLKNLDDVIKHHEENTLMFHEEATFEYSDTIERVDKRKTRLRKILRKETDLEEYTGFVEFDKFCVFCVLFTPEQLKSKNIRKLEYVIERLQPINVDLNSIAITKIKEAEEQINKTNDPQEKAEILIYIAGIHSDMKDIPSAIKSLEESIQIFPQNFGGVLGLLDLQFDTTERDDLTERLFNLDIGNPQICDDLARLYFDNNRIQDIIEFFEKKVKQHSSDDKVVGNIKFALGNIYYEEGNDKNALSNFQDAKELLAKSLKPENNVFKILDEIINELK